MLGGGVFLAYVVVGLTCLVGGIYTCVDASKYPDWAFQQSGSNKQLWQILPIVFIFVCGIGAGVMTIIWISGKRDAVARAAASGPMYGSPSPYGAPPGWGAPPPGWGAPPAAPSAWAPPTGGPPPAAPPTAPPWGAPPPPAGWGPPAAPPPPPPPPPAPPSPPAPPPPPAPDLPEYPPQ